MSRRSAALALVVVTPDTTALGDAQGVEVRRYPGVAECVDGEPPGAACTRIECRYHLAHRGYWEHHLKPTRDCSLDVANEGPRTLDEVAEVREALEQRLRSVMARGLRDYLIRLADDDGALIRDAEEPAEALLTVLGAHEGEAELVRGAIELLRRDGFLGGGARSLFVRNLQAAQSWEGERLRWRARRTGSRRSPPRALDRARASTPRAAPSVNG